MCCEWNGLSQQQETVSSSKDGKDLYQFMRAYRISFAVGWSVGLVYALLRVKSPAPPRVALIGLLGIMVGESLFQHLAAIFR